MGLTKKKKKSVKLVNQQSDVNKAKLVNRRPSIKKLDKLWNKAIKARANNTSELTPGGIGIQLHAHHILGKQNYRLRWEISNGVCINGGEHLQAHHPYHARELEQKFLRIRGVNRETLKIMGRQTGGVDLFAMEIYLKQKIKEYEAKNKNFRWEER